MKKKTNIRQYSYVRFAKPYYDFRHLLYLGEVPNASGHCMLAEVREERDERGVQQWDIIGMFHIDELIELTEDEVIDL